MIRLKGSIVIFSIIALMAGFFSAGCTKRLASPDSNLESLLNLQTIFISDTTPPTVTTTAPLNGDVDVPVNTGISVIFSEAVDGQTVTVASFLVTDTATGLPVAGTITTAGSSAVFTPIANLDPLTTYSVTVRNTVSDPGGNAMAADFTWSFTTAAAPGIDTTPPAVTAAYPAGGATGVDVNTGITAQFSEAMDPASITAASFIVIRGGAAIAGAVSYTGTTATFLPATELQPLTTYTVTITTDARDLASNSMAADYTWSFTTGSVPDTAPPIILATVPHNNDTSVPMNTAAILVIFSEYVNPATIIDANVYICDVTTPAIHIPATLTVDGNTAVIHATLAPGIQYAGVVTTGVTDLASPTANSLPAAYIWTFTTSFVMDATSPAVILTRPANGSTGVPLNTLPMIVFSEAVNPGSLSGTAMTDAGGTAVTGYPIHIGNTVCYKPSADLAPNTQYTITIPASAADLAGNTLGAAYSWTFRTGAAIDTTPPQVTAVSPADGATSVGTSISVSVSFSEEIIPVTVNELTFVLLEGTGCSPTTPCPRVDGTISRTMNSAMLTVGPLKPATAYTAIVADGVIDLAGNHMAAHYIWTFTTGSAPAGLAQGIQFRDNHPGEDVLNGTLTVNRAVDETGLQTYNLYWGYWDTGAGSYQRIGMIASLPQTGADPVYTMASAPVPTAPQLATHFLVYSANAYGENPTPLAYDFTDEVFRLAYQIAPGITGSNPRYLTPFSVTNRLYFQADDGSTSGCELWEYDDSTSSAVQLPDINAATGSYPSYMMEFNNRLYFSANNGTNGTEAWVYDGVAAPSLIRDIYAGAPSSNPRYLTKYTNTNMIFLQADPGTGAQLVISDGAASWGSYGIASVAYFYEYNSVLYYQEDNGATGFEIGYYTGSFYGHINVNPTAGESSYPHSFTAFNGNVYFNADMGTTAIPNERLMFLNSSYVVNSGPVINAAGSSHPERLTVYDGRLFFSAADGTNGIQLWSYDELSAPLRYIINTTGNAFTDPAEPPEPMIVYNGKLYFIATDGSSGDRLWCYDGTGSPYMPLDPSLSATPDVPAVDMTIYNNKLFLSANRASTGQELYVYFEK